MTEFNLSNHIKPCKCCVSKIQVKEFIRLLNDFYKLKNATARELIDELNKLAGSKLTQGGNK